MKKILVLISVMSLLVPAFSFAQTKYMPYSIEYSFFAENIPDFLQAVQEYFGTESVEWEVTGKFGSHENNSKNFSNHGNFIGKIIFRAYYPPEIEGGDLEEVTVEFPFSYVVNGNKIFISAGPVYHAWVMLL
jgi:hypothetical protein